ncbi:MAG: flagellin [Rhodospirillales bacterium]|nr:flagellin [Rhodospirillales bacterium]
MAGIVLSSSVRTNLLTLQSTSDLIGRTQNRLATGMSVSSPIDSAVKYFASKSLSDRASDLSERKDGIDQGVSALETALEATSAMEELTQQMKGIIDAARSQTQSQRAEAGAQLAELAQQIQNLVDDASYKGLNLLNSSASTLSVRFSDKADSKLDINGVNFNAEAYFQDTAGASLGVSAFSGVQIACALGISAGLSVAAFSAATQLADFNAVADTAIKSLESTISNLRSKSATMAANASILKVRLDFTSEYVNKLQVGADKLSLANLNEEGANLVALQTRQQIGTQALAFAGQAEQSIMQLFR